MAHFASLTGFAAYNALLSMIGDIGLDRIKRMSETNFNIIFGVPICDPAVSLMIAELKYMRDPKFNIAAAHQAVTECENCWIFSKPGKLFTTGTIHKGGFCRSEYFILQESLESEDPGERAREQRCRLFRAVCPEQRLHDALFLKQSVLKALIADFRVGFAPMNIPAALHLEDPETEFYTEGGMHQLLVDIGLLDEIKQLPQEMLELALPDFFQRVIFL